MARNGTGTYSLPQPAFVGGTTIASAAVNSDFSDIASALTTSVCSDGQTIITGQLKGTQGVNPTYSFNTDAGTGFGSVGSGEADIYVSSTKIGAWTSTGLAITGQLTVSTTFAVTGATTHTGATTFNGAANFNAGGALGGSTFTGTATWSGAQTFSAKVSLTSTDSVAIAKGTTGQRNGAPATGDMRYNSTLNGLEYWNGTVWVVLGQAPTVQTFTSGGPLTYTPSTGTVRIRVRMCGGGGGGGGASANNGTVGNDTTFDSWTAIHGNGGGANAGTPGAGGTGGIDGTGLRVARIPGGAGSGGSQNAGGAQTFSFPGGTGGANPFGGSGNANLNAAGGNGAANTGAGGGGGGNNGAGAFSVGAGGGAGEYVEFWVTNPAPVTYTVGAAANGGTAGTKAGGNGAAGIIIVEEFYS